MKRLALAASMLALAGCGTATTTISPAALKVAAPVAAHPVGWGHPPKGLMFSLPRVDTTTKTLEQFDATTTGNVPTGAHYLAGYTAGFWPNYLTMTRLPWHPQVLSIAIASGYHAMCLDVEPGDAVPSQVVAWVHADLAAGFKHPCVYSSYWEWQQIRPLLAAAGIARSTVWEWDADYYGTHPRLDAGFDCTQWTDVAYGRNLDESSCSLAFLGATPKPTPKPKPKPAPDPVCYVHRLPVAECSNIRRSVGGLFIHIAHVRGKIAQLERTH